MAKNSWGVSRQTTSSASRRSSETERGDATGTARTTRAAPWARATWQAARAVDPVAIPSSTTMAVRPARGMRPRPPRKLRTRRSSSARSRRSTTASSSAVTPASCTVSSLTIRTPSSPMAPMASSGWNGTPSLRTTITSSGALSAAATWAATVTPPRGSPSTTTFSPRSVDSASARRRPASRRLRNGMIHLLARGFQVPPRRPRRGRAEGPEESGPSRSPWHFDGDDRGAW
jgi:hypothetical protein